MEYGDLHFAILDRRTPFDRKITDSANLNPLGLSIFSGS
jgi:hypothetical protein